MHAEIIRRIESELPTAAVIAAALCLATAAIRWWLIPQARLLQDNRIETALYRQALEGHGSYEAIKKEIGQDAERLRQRLHALSQGMGDPQDLSALLGVLIDRADSAGVRFMRIQPQGEKSSGDCVLYPVILEFTSEFGPLATLIALLESLPQLVRVDRLSVTAARGGKLDISILCTCFLHAAARGAP